MLSWLGSPLVCAVSPGGSELDRGLLWVTSSLLRGQLPHRSAGPTSIPLLLLEQTEALPTPLRGSAGAQSLATGPHTGLCCVLDQFEPSRVPNTHLRTGR